MGRCRCRWRSQDGRHCLVIDPTRMANKVLQYADLQYLNSLYPNDMDPENLRYMLVRAIRFGNALAFDLMDMDKWDRLSVAFDRVKSGIWMKIIDRSARGPLCDDLCSSRMMVSREQ